MKTGIIIIMCFLGGVTFASVQTSTSQVSLTEVVPAKQHSKAKRNAKKARPSSKKQDGKTKASNTAKEPQKDEEKGVHIRNDGGAGGKTDFVDP